MTKHSLVMSMFNKRVHIGALVCVLTIISLSVSFINITLRHDKALILNTVTRDLNSSLTITMEHLDHWVLEQNRYLHQLGRDPVLVSITQDLLALTASPEPLKKSAALIEARAFFKERQNDFGRAGFFIINKNFISLASSRDINIGTKNLIAHHWQVQLERVMSEKKAVFIPPMLSDVVIEDKAKKHKVTMFFVAPIQDENGNVIAVLAQRLLPEGHLAKIMQHGRPGVTGETYLIDIKGNLLTETRYKQQLFELGLIATADTEYTQLRILDPGGNLLEGYQPELEKDQQALTRMAQSIREIGLQEKNTIIGDHGQIMTDMEGYRDYRGVPVFGAWMWDNHLGLGMATEINVDEALSSYYSLRRNLLLVVGLSLFFSVAAIIIAVILSEKITSNLRKSQKDLKYKVDERTEWLRNIIDSVVDGIIVINQQGQIITFSPAAEKIFGYQSDELLDQSVKLLLPKYFETFNELNPEEQIAEIIEANHFGRLNETSGLHKNGLKFPVELAFSVASINNREVFFTGIIRDITQRKQLEKQQEQVVRELNFQKYALDQHAIVSIADLKGTIIYVNDRFCETSGFTRDELMGHNYRVVKSDVHSESFYQNLWRTITSGEVWSGEVCNLTKSGEVYWVNATIVPFIGKNAKPERYISICSDITEIKLAGESIRRAHEQANAANNAKSDFLANMSHEIRTPMNAITGLSYLALQTDLSRKQHNYLKKINDSANNLLGIINDILDFSKIEADKLDLEIIPFVLDDVLAQVTDLVAMRVREKGIEFLIDKDHNIPFGLMGDPLRLGQVLINLANNAVKFTHHGEILIRVNIIETDEVSVILKFSVDDTGIGMSEDEVSRLFQSFSQADASTSRKYGGTGLGLSICKRLINMMGGEIWVESEYHQGSSFNFIVRFQKTDQIELRPLPPSELLQDMEVLIVDDRENAREISAHLLQDLGAKTTLANNGYDAIEKVEQAQLNNMPFQLLLIDNLMPDLSGFDTAVKIKTELELATKPVIIMVTAYERDALQEQVKDNNLDGLIAKPINEMTLVEMVNQAFGRIENKKSNKARGVSRDDGLQYLHGAHVLLVEDNDVNQMVAKGLLKKMHIKVDVAENGLIALDKIKEKDYSAVFMDLQMPVMDGYEATQKIREMSEYNSLPIIAMTANAMESDKKKCLDMGMNAHVAKPINPKILYSTLLSCLSEKQSESEEIDQQINDLEQDEPTVNDTSITGLPDLPGINVDKGLRCVGGDVDFYQEMLLKFAANQKQTPENIKQAIEHGEIKDAIRYAHTLKGTAGTVGVDALMQQAQEFETLLHEGNLEQAKQQLKLLTDILVTSIELIEQSLTTEIDTSETNSELSIEIPENFSGKLSELIDYLDQYNARAANCLDELMIEAKGTVWLQWMDKIYKPLAIYEFEEAAEQARKLLNELINSQ